MKGAELSPQFLLAAACCRRPSGPPRDAMLRNAAARVDNWDGFVRLVARHRVIGLVHDALKGVVDLPNPVANELALGSGRVARQNLRFVAELGRLQSAFDAAQMPMLVLKGVALAKLAFGTYESKQNRDLDLLVPPAGVKHALQLLEREGYIVDFPARRLSRAQLDAIPRYAKEIGLVHPQRRLHVELHWRLALNSELLKDIDPFSRPQKVILSDAISVSTLPTDDLVTYLCVHGAYHSWSRLKWLVDLNAVIVTRCFDVTALYRHAQACGAGLCAGHALELCAALFDLHLPPQLAEELGRDGRIAKLTRAAAHSMTQPETACDAGTWAVLGKVRMQFLIGSGWKFFWQQCRVMAVGIIDVVDFPLPASMHFLYPVMRLPMWLGRRVFGRAPK